MMFMGNVQLPERKWWHLWSSVEGIYVPSTCFSFILSIQWIKCLLWRCEEHNFNGHLVNTSGLPAAHRAAAVLQKLFSWVHASVAHLCCPKYENQLNTGNILRIKCTINAPLLYHLVFMLGWYELIQGDAGTHTKSQLPPSGFWDAGGYNRWSTRLWIRKLLSKNLPSSVTFSNFLV